MPITAAPALATILKPEREPRQLSACSVQVELRTPHAGPVLLASRLQWWTDPIQAEFVVLDVLGEGDHVILPVIVGRRLGLWRIDLEPIARESWAWLDDWQVMALSTPLDSKSVKVQLRREKNHWFAAVTDLRAGAHSPATHYEQQRDDWRFCLTGTWDNKPLARRQRLIALDSLPMAEAIRDLELSQNDNPAEGDAKMTPAGFRQVLSTARPIAPTTTGVTTRPFVASHAGSFATDEGTYRFELYSGGRGCLTTPAGVTGMFSFEPTVLQQRASGQ